MKEQQKTDYEIKHDSLVSIGITLILCLTAIALLAIITNNP